MADGLAAILLVFFLIALGWTGGCSMQGKGLQINVDGKIHRVLLGER